MKKTTVLITAALIMIAGTVFSADVPATETMKTQKADSKPVDRLDMSLKAGGFISSGVAQAQASGVQPEAETTETALGAMIGLGAVKKEKVKKEKTEPTEPMAMYMALDLMSISRSIEAGAADIAFYDGFGDYGNWGFECLGYVYMKPKDDIMAISVSIDLGPVIYPLGNAPSGWFLAPLIGGGFYNVSGGGFDEMWGAFRIGAETGYRLKLGGFMMDIAVVYDAIISFKDPPNDIVNDFQFRVGIGGFMEDVTPEMINAKKEKKEEKSDENKK